MARCERLRERVMAFDQDGFTLGAEKINVITDVGDCPGCAVRYLLIIRA